MIPFSQDRPALGVNAAGTGRRIEHQRKTKSTAFRYDTSFCLSYHGTETTTRREIKCTS